MFSSSQADGDIVVGIVCTFGDSIEAVDNKTNRRSDADQIRSDTQWICHLR